MPKNVSSHSEEYIQPTLASVPVEIDPAVKGTLVRYALVIEAVLNVLGAAWMAVFPEIFLNLMQFGTVVYTLTTPLILAIPNTRRGIESHQSIYYTLGSSEVFMISLSLYQAYALNSGGFSPKSLLGLSANLAPLLLWRLYVLFRKPEWLGRYREGRKEH